MEIVVTEFLSALKVRVSKAYVQHLVRAHPDFPSLLSVSDVLTRIGIRNVAHRIEKSEILSIPFPYLLPLDKGKGDLLLIKDAKDLDRNKERLEQWGGIVLQAKGNINVLDRLGSKLYKDEEKIKISAVLLFLIVTSLIGFGASRVFSWPLFSLIITSIAGLIVGYLIAAKQLGKNFKVIDRFCNSGKQTNCDKVLGSDVKFLGIHFSDAVLIYFLFQFLSTLCLIYFPSLNLTFWQGLEILGLGAIPFVAFSLYYQKFVAKTWCKLCLIVSVIIIGQFSIFLLKWSSGNFLSVLENGLNLELIFFFLVLAIVVCTTILVKLLIKRASQLDTSTRISNNLKHSPEVFRHFLFKQRKVDVEPIDGEIVIGNPKAPVHILMISNLYCQPCKDRHQSVHELFSMYPELFCLTLRFVRSGNDLVSRTHTVRYLLSLWLEKVKGMDNESELALTLLHDWFRIWDLAKFKRNYVITGVSEKEAVNLEDSIYAWIDRNEIYLTPTFFINGYKLPTEYTIDDFKVLMLALAHQQSHAKLALQY